MSNKCHAACQSFAQTVRNTVSGVFLSMFTAMNGADGSEKPYENTYNHTEGTYVRDANTNEQSQPKALGVKGESPCAPAPVLKITPEGTITKMEVPPDCPGKLLHVEGKC